MTNDTFYLFICGILSDAEDPTLWSNRAAAWMVARGLVPEGNAAGFNYSDGIAGATLDLSAEADRLAAVVLRAWRDGLKLKLIGHSNAARIILRAMKLCPELWERRIVSLALAAAACDADCEKNGLNEAARHGQLAEVELLASSGDEVLGLGPLVSYGTLGKTGPKNACGLLAEILTVTWAEPPCRHSDWVGVNFEATMRLLTQRD